MRAGVAHAALRHCPTEQRDIAGATDFLLHVS
jgi:hypothetical protein